jgi:hypothetical protein
MAKDKDKKADEKIKRIIGGMKPSRDLAKDKDKAIRDDPKDKKKGK